MKKINVIHLVEDLKCGGLENVLASIVSNVNKDVFNSQVWCLCKGGGVFDRLHKNGVSAEILGMKSHRDPYFFFNLCSKLRKNSVHILHVHGFSAATLGRIAGLVSFVPGMICHVHTTRDHYSRKNLIIEKILSYGTDRFICCSQAVADLMISKENFPTRKLSVIYNGVDINKYHISGQDINDKRNVFIVGCIASLFPHKGHRYLLEAAKAVTEKMGGRVKFIFAGDGIEKSRLIKFAHDLDLKDTVDFKGVVSDIPTFLSACDLVVLPSTLREGLGLSLIEAMAAGKPVVGTALGGIPEVIENGTNGFLVPPRDPTALSDAIITILENTDLAIEMGNRGRETVKSKFTLQIMIKTIEKLYIELYNAKCKRK